MNRQSEKLINELQTGTRILYANVYTQFLQIPAEILTSNEKIIVINLFALAFMFNEDLDFSNSAISKLTGIPAGTVNRIMPQLPARIAAANNWLVNNGFQERIELKKATKFGSASYYFISRTTPPMKQSAGFAVEPENNMQLTAENPAPSEFTKDKELKAVALLKTGLDPDDTERFYKYTLSRIERNVRYFKEKYVETGKPASLALFARTISHDWGREYLENSEKAALYVDIILQLAPAVSNEIDLLKVKRDFFHKFEPVRPEVFKDKSAVNFHFDCQFKKLGEVTQKGINEITDKIYHSVKNHLSIAKRAEHVRRQLVRLAVMQALNNIISIQNKQAA